MLVWDREREVITSQPAAAASPWRSGGIARCAVVKGDGIGYNAVSAYIGYWLLTKLRTSFGWR